LIALLVAVFVLGAVALLAASARSDAAEAVGLEATPELVTAQDLYGALADADAAASTAYLQAGQEDPALRARYRADLRAAGKYLAEVADEPGSSPRARRAVRTINEQLTVYAGRIDTARANIRQGTTVGNAYLRQASQVMREEILPAATVLYRHATQRLDDAYDDGTSRTDVVLLVAAGAVVLVLLVVVQLYLFRRTHRVVNVGLAVASLLVIVLLAWTLVRMSWEQSSLADARRHGSDSIQVLSAVRILNLRALNDDNLALIQRGGGEEYVADYDLVANRIGDVDGTHGLFRFVKTIAAREGDVDATQQLGRQLSDVITTHGRVRDLDDAGDYGEAVQLATTDEARAVAALDGGLEAEVRRARALFDRQAADARQGFGALTIAIPVLTVAALALVIVGLQRRMSEYR
jgi:hypothetical protein